MKGARGDSAIYIILCDFPGGEGLWGGGGGGLGGGGLPYYTTSVSA